MENEGATYTHGHHESVMRSHRWRTAENSAAYLLPHLTSGMTLLDVGSGAGTITADLAEIVALGSEAGRGSEDGQVGEGGRGRVIALEATENAIALTRAEIERRGLTNVSYVVGDVHALDLPDGTFDVVHAHQVLQHVADPVKALGEMRRVAKPGGLVAARDGDYETFTWFPQVAVLDEWLDLYRRVARANGGEPDAGRRLMSWARAAGLDEVTASASVWLYATPEDRQWWGGSWSQRIIESDLARQAVESGAATPGDLARMSRGWLEWVDAPDGWFAMIHGEILARTGRSLP